MNRPEFARMLLGEDSGGPRAQHLDRAIRKGFMEEIGNLTPRGNKEKAPGMSKLAAPIAAFLGAFIGVVVVGYLGCGV